MRVVIDPDHHDDGFPVDDWEEDDLEPFAPPWWRRPLLIGIATVTALAVALVPIYNVFRERSVADNGLEICGFDYCIVQDAVTAAGLDLEMSRLSNTFLDEGGARDFAAELTDFLGVPSVGLRVVGDLDGRLGGVYEPEERAIVIERPARAWTVLHEVAHAVEAGHGEEFQELVIELTAFVDSKD
jgi:hypothetical protein